MSNPRFYAGELAGITYTMSLAENADYPLSNLSTYFSADEWRSSASTNGQWLKIDLGSAKSINTVVLHNHNINAMTTVKLQYDDGDDPDFTTPIDAVADLVSGAGGNIDKFEGVASSPKRYWRILFTTTNGQTPQIGQVFLSVKFDIGQPYDHGFRGGNRTHETTVKTSLSGVERASQAFAGKTLFEIAFSLGNATFKTSWISFHNAVRGKLCPFYFADIDDAIYYVKFDKDYNPAETIRYQLNNVQSVVLIEQ